MNHLPFEDWLLNDRSINLAQQRELELHLRSCSYCAALAETGRLLQITRIALPALGFTERFQARLALRKLAERKRRRWGAMFFTFGGLAALLWVIGPYLVSFLGSPATWISAIVNLFVFLGTTLTALLSAIGVILSVAGDFLPPFGLMVMFSTLAGMVLLWSVSIWRFVHVPQGV